MEIESPSSARKAPVGGVKIRFYPYFLVAIIILILIAGLVIFRSQIPFLSFQASPPVTLDQFKLDKVTYFDPTIKENVSGHLQTALDNRKKNDDLAKESLTKSFYLLKSDYTRFPQEEKRDSMIAIVAYAKNNYQDTAANLEAIIPCNQESCGAKPTLTEEMDSLKKDIFESKDLTTTQKDVFTDNFNALAVAVGATDKNKEYFQLSSIFTNLRNIWLTEKNSQVEGLIAETLRIMKEVDAQKYSFEDGKGFYKLE